MSESKCIIESIGEVKKNIGVNTVNTACKCTCGFALVFIYVNPTLIICLIEQLLVIFAQRLKCLLYKSLCILIFHLAFSVFYDGAIKVVKIEGIKFKCLFAEFKITAHKGKCIVNGADQAVIYADRHVAGEKCSFAGAGIVANVCKVAIEFYAAGVHGGKSVDVLLELTEIEFECITANSLIGTFTEYTEVSVSKSCFVAVLVLNCREGDIYALQHLKAVIGRLCGITEHCEHFFTFFVKGMLTCAADIFYGMLIKRSCFKILIELILGNAKEFGVKEGHCGAVSNEEADSASLHLLIFRVAVISGLLKAGVNIYKLNFLRCSSNCVETSLEAFCRVTKSTFYCRYSLHCFCSLGISLFPCSLICKYVRQIPHKTRIHFITVFEFHNFASVQL